MGRRDPVLLAKLRSMGVGTRGIVWRLGQSLTWAALVHGRAGDPAVSAEWYAKAQLMADALGAEPPPLPPLRDDRVKGSAEALGFVLRTVPIAMASALEPYGEDHLGLFDCALKLGLIDFVGVGGGEMLDAVTTGVRRAAERGKLPEAFQKRVTAIVAAVGSDRAAELIVECYKETAALLSAELAAASASARELAAQRLADAPAAAPAATLAPEVLPLAKAAATLAPAKMTPAPSPSPAAGANADAPRRIPDSPAGDRLRIYLFGTSFAAAVTLHPHPEDRQRADARWLAASEEARTLGVSVPALPALAGERSKDWARCLEFLVLHTERIAAGLRDRHGAAQGALFAATVKLTLFAQRYRPEAAADALSLIEPLVADLSAAELPGEHWGSLLAVEVALPDNNELDQWYLETRKGIRAHLERASG